MEFKRISSKKNNEIYIGQTLINFPIGLKQNRSKSSSENYATDLKCIKQGLGLKYSTNPSDSPNGAIEFYHGQFEINQQNGIGCFKNSEGMIYTG